MDKFEIVAEKRTVTGNQVRALRRQGLLPGIVYGRGIEPLVIQLDRQSSSKVLSAASSSTLIDLKVGKESHKVLVREIQRDVIRGDYTHVDFLKVAMDVAISAMVPVELIGHAPAVNELGGILVAGLNEIEVEALPAELPDRIEVDLDVLKEIDDAITVGDLFLGEGVTLLTSPEEDIARVVYMEEEILEEEEEEELLDVSVEPEIIDEDREGEELPEEPEEE
ncbi:MAG: 50S ribosomal protein L25 [Anaerolineales bacterium]|jgi:large subunit ribosomal protein L25